MANHQLKRPDTNVIGQSGWCLAYVTNVFRVPPKYPSAISAWDNAQFKHPGGSPPADVSVPLFFSYNGPDGHAAVWVPGTGILSTTSHGDKVFPSISALVNWMGEGFKYLGWCEDLNGVRVIETVSDPAPSPAVPKFTVVETYPNGRVIRLNKDTNLWGMNYDFDTMVKHPVETGHLAGEIWTVFNKVHHEDGYDYYRREGQVDGFNVDDCDDYTPPPPAPVTPDWKSVYTFERFPAPMNVATNKDTNLWNLQFQGGFANATAIAPLSADHAFVAVGKATKLDFDEHPVYYMSNESFGSADTTDEPAFWQGVNSVDLKPAPVESPVIPPVVEPTTPVTEEVIPPVSPQIEDTAEKIEVKVNPAPNPDSWKVTFKTNEAGDYTALASVTVHDLDGKLPDLQLPKGAALKIAGKFIKDGKEYWRTEKSASRVDSKLVPKEEDWRGIPVTTEDGSPVLEEDLSFLGYIDSKLDSFEESLHHDGASIRKKIIAASGGVHGELESLASRFNIKRRK